MPQVRRGKEWEYYPHDPSDTTEEVLSTNLKSARIGYRQAVDSGRRSGHGRVVLLYFEICEWI